MTEGNGTAKLLIALVDQIGSLRRVIWLLTAALAGVALLGLIGGAIVLSQRSTIASLSDSVERIAKRRSITLEALDAQRVNIDAAIDTQACFQLRIQHFLTAETPVERALTRGLLDVPCTKEELAR